MEIVNLNHYWLGMDINGAKVTLIEYEKPFTLLTLDNGKVVKNDPFNLLRGKK